MTSIKTEVDNLLDVDTSNLSGFSAKINGISISGTSVGLGLINFSWLDFPDAVKYQYVLERVYGTPGSATDSESWQSAWLNLENNNLKTVFGTNVSVDAGTLLANSNYVFYVRALDAFDSPISTVAHVNFFKDGAVNADEENPMIAKFIPLDGASVSGTVPIGAEATDNVGVVSIKLFIDGKQVAISASGVLNYNWNTKKVVAGWHSLKIQASDATGNLTEKINNVYLVK